MPTSKAVVHAAVGLHARSAAEFVRAVTATGLAVTISKNGRPGVDARSLLAVMSEDFPYGCAVELAVSTDEGAAAGADIVNSALEGLRTLLESPAGG